MSRFIKICPLGAELFHAGRQTDMTTLIVAFRNFANAPKKLTNINDFYIGWSNEVSAAVR